MTNCEGLTFEEWINAVGVCMADAMLAGTLVAYTEAWEQGEDPTDYRVSISEKTL